MSRQSASKEAKLDGGDGSELVVTSLPLPYERAEDSLPDVMRIVAGIMDELIKSGREMEGGLEALLSIGDEDWIKLAPLLGAALTKLGGALGGGELKRLAPLLLFSTTVVMTLESGDKEVKELAKVADRRDVFDEYPQHYFPILFFAGRVTYARFFPVQGLLNSVKSQMKKTA